MKPSKLTISLAPDCKSIAALLLALSLAACGGGSSAPNAQVNIPPPMVVVPPIVLLSVVSTSPSYAAVNVELTTPVKVSFNMNVLATNLQVVCNGINISGVTSILGKEVTFTPATSFKTFTTCIATVYANDTIGSDNVKLKSDSATLFTTRNFNCVYPIASPTRATPVFNGSTTVPLCGNVFVDPTMDLSGKNLVGGGFEFAVKSVTDFYGTLLSSTPDVIACASIACGEYYTGQTRRSLFLRAGGSYNNIAYANPTLLIGAVWAATPNVMAHEYAHSELEKRVTPYWVPSWFNEGLSTFIGGEPNCVGVVGKGIDDLGRFDRGLDWTTYTNDVAVQTKTYCQASAEVQAWVKIHGKEGVKALLLARAKGADFAGLYGSFLN